MRMPVFEGPAHSAAGTLSGALLDAHERNYMFARVQTVNQPAEKLDEMTKLVREQLHGAHELPGFSGFYYLIDRANSKALVISLWETEEDLRRVEGNTASREHTAAQAGVKSPPSEIFEVAVQAS